MQQTLIDFSYTKEEAAQSWPAGLYWDIRVKF